MTAKAPNILIVMADQMAPAFLPRLWPSPCPRTEYASARARWSRVRQRLLREPAMRAVARLVHGRSFAVADARLRQCRRVRGRHSDLRPRSQASQLPHNFIRQDALLRAGPVARIRAAADDRHLSGRLQLDAGLGSPRSSPELVSQYEFGARRGVMRALEPARLRRRGGIHVRARDLRSRPIERPATVSHGRFVLASARPVRRASTLLGSLSRRRYRHAGARGCARRAFAPLAPRMRDGRRAGDQCSSARCAPCVLWRNRLCRRLARPTHAGFAFGRLGGGHDRHRDQRSR